MSVIFWKHTQDGWRETDLDGKPGPQALEVNEQHPLPIQHLWKEDGDDEWQAADTGHPLPVQLAEHGAMLPLTDEQVTVGSTAIGINPPGQARRCYIEVWTADIYYTWDAATPSASNGGRASVGDIISVMGDQRLDMRSVMQSLRLLRQSATSGLAIAHYFT